MTERIHDRYATTTLEREGRRLRITRAGDSSGTPILLLHGWPQTSRGWWKVMDRLLAQQCEVIAVDLPGINGSSAPVGGFDSDNVATTIRDFLHDEGVDRVRVVGHDNGGRIGFAYAALFRDETDSLVVVESKILGIDGSDDVAKQYWHFGFHQEPGLAEILTQDREEAYLNFFFSLSTDPAAISAEEKAHYLEAYTAGSAMRHGFEYYRGFGLTAMQSRTHREKPLDIPVLAIGGAYSMNTVPAESMALVAHDVRGAVAPGAGHWIPDENPEWLAAEVLAFYAAA
jgi:pimeloyl-ACP methyl ester carboxylesterase